MLPLMITVLILLSGCSTKSADLRNNNTSRISLEELLGESLVIKGFNGTWINDDEILYRDESKNIMIYDLIAKRSRLILPITNPKRNFSLDDQLSPDEKYILLSSKIKEPDGSTNIINYKIVDLTTFNETLLSTENSTNFQLAKWGPKGNALVYVNQNNLFYKPKVDKPIVYQITTNGVIGRVTNGLFNWILSDEMIPDHKAVWFSPSGKKMIFGFEDFSKTQMMKIPFYGIPGNISYQYTSSKTFRYPKSGTTNPTKKLFYVNLEKVVKSSGNSKKLIEIEPPAQLANSERLIAGVGFLNESMVTIMWMNRIVNQFYINVCKIKTFECKTILEYTEKQGFVKQPSPLHFKNNGEQFLLILPQKQIDNDNWFHLVIVTNSNTDNSTMRTLTSGTFVVTEIVGWDENNSLVYYLATTPDDPAQQHFYRVSTLDQTPKPQCLSCEIKSELSGTPCLYNEVKLSPSANRYILTCAGPGIPDISIYDSNNLTKLMTWENNQELAEKMKNKLSPIVKRFTVPVTGGFNAQVRLLIPPGADLNGSKKYPMIVYVYGGPDSYEITEKFEIDWARYLVTNKNIIYAIIDGRGSGRKGNAMLFSGYRNFGTVEIYDQINVTKYLQENLTFIDREKTAIWGWSYGGYAAAMSLALDQQSIFKCGISVAPVTDWTLYLSSYTECYMGLPTDDDNLDGYQRAQLLNKAHNIKSNSFYLIHGTFDDTVHYQHSLLLAAVLQDNDILFRQQTYTDQGHDLGQSLSHFYQSMEDFLNDCLFKS